MRPILTIFLITLASPALAHIGHIGELAGHGHWIALGGIAVAGVIALLGGREKADEDPEDPSDDTEQEEAPA